MGIGTFGSRSAQLAGSAIVMAADKLIDKGRHIAAVLGSLRPFALSLQLLHAGADGREIGIAADG
jgi:CO/xanthine dehydrogenase Mo-binding subunit